MTNKEVEYVSLSRDTTESDLKQRREIRQGTAYHIDQVRFLDKHVFGLLAEMLYSKLETK